MRFYRRIRIREAGFPEKLYLNVCALAPECREGDHFQLECQPGDDVRTEVAEQIVALCERHGLSRGGSSEAGTYEYDIVRHYEPSDLGGVPYFMLEAQNRMVRWRNSIERDASGRLLLPVTQAKPTIRFASIFLRNLYVVCNSVQDSLKTHGFVGIRFIETALQGKSIHAAAEPFWEMSSDLVLPKMSNSLLNEHSRIPCFMIDERPYRYGEPHYNHFDLSRVGNFDVARTFEQFGSDHQLIVSERFYRFCLNLKIGLRVRPVRVDCAESCTAPNGRPAHPLGSSGPNGGLPSVN